MDFDDVGTASGQVNSGGRYDPTTDLWLPTSTVAAPTARREATAVWTGDEMIVWGGHNITSTFDTGGRYDPGLDRWLATSTVNAPARRRSHSAVWTGTRMVVWGGDNGSPLHPGPALDTGGRYDPRTDLWEPTSTMGAPTPRSGHSAVWTGSDMIVWGGSGTSSGGRYALGHDTDDDADGFSECAGDCNNADPAVHPEAAEVCDGRDNDCDGVSDGFATECGVGACFSTGICSDSADSVRRRR